MCPGKPGTLSFRKQVIDDTAKAIKSEGMPKPGNIFRDKYQSI
jgi:hypothetical protein